MNSFFYIFMFFLSLYKKRSHVGILIGILGSQHILLFGIGTKIKKIRCGDGRNCPNDWDYLVLGYKDRL